MRSAPRPLAIVDIYFAGILQGAAFVLLPALGKTLAADPYGFAGSHYGLLYLPETLGAIVSAAAAGLLQRRIGLSGLFRLGLAANLVAMGLLVTAAAFPGPRSYDAILLETLFLGAGFGWTLTAINHYASHFFARSGTAAVTLLNSVIGAATALSPLVFHLFAQGAWGWGLWPGLLAVGFLLALVPRLPSTGHRETVRWHSGMGIFMLAIFVYGLCEGSFGSWAKIYVSTDRKQAVEYGTWALSAFWGSMTTFRFLLALVPDTSIPRRRFFYASPIGMALAFALLPVLHQPWALVGAFAFAGAACSIYFPFSMGYGLAHYPAQSTEVAGLMVAALMAGEGIGSFGLGPLQSWLPLTHIYFFWTLWGLPLLYLATRIAETSTQTGAPV